jgi:hypothetical protein
MKRDINFIKHIKPQLKEKERTDKAESRQKKYDNAVKMLNMEPPALDVVDVGIIASLLRRLKE